MSNYKHGEDQYTRHALSRLEHLQETVTLLKYRDSGYTESKYQIALTLESKKASSINTCAASCAVYALFCGNVYRRPKTIRIHQRIGSPQKALHLREKPIKLTRMQIFSLASYEQIIPRFQCTDRLDLFINLSNQSITSRLQVEKFAF